MLIKFVENSSCKENETKTMTKGSITRTDKEARVEIRENRGACLFSAQSTNWHD
jgi:hypothetical protein